MRLTKNIREILSIIIELPENKCYASNIAYKLGKDINYIQRILRRLEAKGLIQSNKIGLVRYYSLINIMRIDNLIKGDMHEEF